MQIVDLIKNSDKQFVSLEFFPPKDKDAWPGFFEVVDRLKVCNPLFASVTYGAGGGTQDNSLKIAAKMKRDHGLEPLSHLTCVGATPERLRVFLDGLREAGIDNVLALRGDAPKDQPDFTFKGQPFEHASDLAAFLREEYPDLCVGVAGYPEAHPESPSIVSELEMTVRKIERGGQFIVTQLFFDNRLYFDFVGRLSGMGVNVPVIPGVLPIMSLGSAKFILSLCGAAIPGKFLAAMEAAHKEGGDEAVREIGLTYAQEQAQELLDGGAPGVHLYTLNKAEACLRIVNNLKF